MATSTRSVGAVAEGNLWGVGVYHWTDLNNLLASDNNYAVCQATGSAHYPFTVLCTDFGFTIPAGSVINSITVTIEAVKTGEGTTRLDWVTLLTPGGGTSLMQAMGLYDSDSDPNQPLTLTDDTYDFQPAYLGDPNLWGNAWTPAIVNDSEFGVGFDVYFSGRENDIYVDHVQITIDYETGEDPGGMCDTLPCGRGFSDFSDAIKSVISKYDTGRSDLDGCVGVKMQLHLKSCVDLTELSECGMKLTLEEAFKAALRDDGCGNPVLNVYVVPILNLQVL